MLLCVQSVMPASVLRGVRAETVSQNVKNRNKTHFQTGAIMSAKFERLRLESRQWLRNYVKFSKLENYTKNCSKVVQSGMRICRARGGPSEHAPPGACEARRVGDNE